MANKIIMVKYGTTKEDWLSSLGEWSKRNGTLKVHDESEFMLFLREKGEFDNDPEKFGLYAVSDLDVGSFAMFCQARGTEIALMHLEDERKEFSKLNGIAEANANDQENHSVVIGEGLIEEERSPRFDPSIAFSGSFQDHFVVGPNDERISLVLHTREGERHNTPHCHVQPPRGNNGDYCEISLVDFHIFNECSGYNSKIGKAAIRILKDNIQEARAAWNLISHHIKFKVVDGIYTDSLDEPKA